MTRAGKTLRDIATRVLAKTRESVDQRDDLLGRLLTATDPATGGSIPDVDNMVTFLMAGYETTSQALTWTLYLLALFPEWQEAVRQEVWSVTGGARDRPRGDRQASNARCVSGGDAALSARSRLDAKDDPPPQTRWRRARRGRHHHHPGLCRADPLTFDPSRFSSEARRGATAARYMPFGAGPRTCVGGTFAMLEGKTMLATLLQHASFALPEGERPTPFARITLSPKYGLKLRVTMLD